MTSKAAFTPDEWKLILQSVLASGVAVTASDPGGLWGLMKEGLASAGALREARDDPSSNELIRAIVADFATAEGRSTSQGLRQKFEGAQPREIATRSVAVLREASSLLDHKAPDDAAAVKGWLRQISERVANASSEGGFMGFGGVPVSDAEKATLNDIARALQVPA